MADFNPHQLSSSGWTGWGGGQEKINFEVEVNYLYRFKYSNGHLCDELISFLIFVTQIRDLISSLRDKMRISINSSVLKTLK